MIASAERIRAGTGFGQPAYHRDLCEINRRRKNTATRRRTPTVDIPIRHLQPEASSTAEALPNLCVILLIIAFVAGVRATSSKPSRRMPMRNFLDFEERVGS